MSPITSKNVMTVITDEFELTTETIRSSVKCKMVCIKFDTATRLNRSILGINVQYYDGNKLMIYTLGMIELNKRHTAVNLCHEIEDVLNDFKITKQQIYCVTTDNGRNMIKAIEVLNEDNIPSTSTAVVEEFDFDTIINEVKIHNITSIKCAAHTLQLVVKDFLKEINVQAVLSKARELVKSLRCPSNR